MSVFRCVVVFLLTFTFLALSLSRGFFAAPVTGPPSDEAGVVETQGSSQGPPLIERSSSDEEQKIKKTTKESDITSLPQDVLEIILRGSLAASSRPVRQATFFKQTCKNFHTTCSSKNMRKFMNVEDWSMYWQDKQGYLKFLQSCAENENVNALFLLGLEEMFNKGKHDVGLHHLQLASSQGHSISKYLLGLWWFRVDSSRLHGIDLLNQTSSNIHQCRRHASHIFNKMIWQKWPSLSFTPCENKTCGTLALEQDNLWLHEGQKKRNFCSDVCKWRHEYNMFVNMRYLSPW